jgi:hypothetical protein
MPEVDIKRRNFIKALIGLGALSFITLEELFGPGIILNSVKEYLRQEELKRLEYERKNERF